MKLKILQYFYFSIVTCAVIVMVMAECCRATQCNNSLLNPAMWTHLCRLEVSSSEVVTWSRSTSYCYSIWTEGQETSDVKTGDSYSFLYFDRRVLQKSETSECFTPVFFLMVSSSSNFSPDLWPQNTFQLMFVLSFFSSFYSLSLSTSVFHTLFTCFLHYFSLHTFFS